MPETTRLTAHGPGELPCEGPGCRADAWFRVGVPLTGARQYLCFEHMTPHRDAGAPVLGVARREAESCP